MASTEAWRGGGGQQPSLAAVADAVSTILDGASTMQRRREAHELCDHVKQLPNCTEYGFQLATVEMPLAARLFGLNVLDDFIRTRLVPTDAVGLRDGLWALLALVVAVPVEERRLVQDKVAMLIAQLAMRIWPQYWPDFFDRITELIAPSGAALEADAHAPIRTEMGLLMARMVVDEIHPRDGASGGGGLAGGPSTQRMLVWDDARRPELQKVLAVVLPVVMERMHVLLAHVASSWSPEALVMMRHLVGTLIEAFASIALWSALDRTKEAAITSHLAILHITATVSAAHGDLATTALDALLTLAGRPARPQEAEFVAELLDAIVDPISRLLGQYAAPGGASCEAYEYFKRTTDVLVTFSSIHLGHKRVSSAPQRLAAILDLFLGLSNFPSLLVATNVGAFWLTVAKNERVMASGAMVERLPSLFLY